MFFGLLREFVLRLNRLIPILGDPGAVSGDGEKSKTGEKKIRAKKSQEREEEPLGTMF